MYSVAARELCELLPVNQQDRPHLGYVELGTT